MRVTGKLIIQPEHGKMVIVFMNRIPLVSIRKVSILQMLAHLSTSVFFVFKFSRNYRRMRASPVLREVHV